MISAALVGNERREAAICRSESDLTPVDKDYTAAIPKTIYMGGKQYMKNGMTELVFILDRSGSMSGLEADTIGGFNAMLEKQKKVEGKCLVTTVLFDNESKILHDRLPLPQVPAMTARDYQVGACTALLDALGDTIQHVAGIHKYARPEDVPEHTLFVITTDGMENASRRFSAEKVKQMIEHEKKTYGWEFLFLGANIDAVSTAAQIGIGADRAVNYRCDSAGTRTNYEALSGAVESVRCSQPLTASWKREIEKDFHRRGSKR